MPFNNKGVTLLEVLFSITIYMVIIMTIPSILKFINVEHKLPSYEVELFYQQIGIDIREATHIEVHHEQTLLLYKPDGSVVKLEKYQNVIRRRVNNLGQEVLVQNIKSISFFIKNNGVEVVLMDREDNLYKRRLSMAPISWEEFVVE